jgi:hypothetical protein
MGIRLTNLIHKQIHRSAVVQYLGDQFKSNLSDRKYWTH